MAWNYSSNNKKLFKLVSKDPFRHFFLGLKAIALFLKACFKSNRCWFCSFTSIYVNSLSRAVVVCFPELKEMARKRLLLTLLEIVARKSA